MLLTAWYVAIVVVVVAALATVWRRRRPGWMGFEGRTLWDWVGLSLEAVLIGVATIAITATQTSVENSRAQSEAVQSYLDRVTTLAVGPDAVRGDELHTVVRAHTAEVLRVATADGAGRIVAFLDELGLLGDLALDLEDADLSGAQLKGIDLTSTALEEADLSGADLEDALLRGLELEEVDLSGADLKGADLRGALFELTELSGADLTDADLRGADLRGARGVSDDQLDAACTDATTRFPDGSSATPGCASGTTDD